MPKTRFAVVGFGWNSQIAFMPGTYQTKNAELAAIVTGNATKAQKLADFYGIKHVFSYEQYDEMLASGLVDAVYIALPNSMHADFAIRAARAGVHAMVEKPLARTEAESIAMVEAFAKAGKFLMTAYRLHTHPGTLEVIDLVRSGAIGEPRYFTSEFSFDMGEGNHRLSPEHWGGPLQDVGVYCINAARMLFGDEPTQAMAMRAIGRDKRFAEVEEAVAATLNFPNGKLAQFTASFGAEGIDDYRIVGTKGEIAVQGGYRFDVAMSYRMNQGGKMTEKNFPMSDHFAAQSAYFADCIQKNIAPEPDGEEGLNDMRVMLAIMKSWETGQAQKIVNAARKLRPTSDMGRFVPVTDHRLMV